MLDFLKDLKLDEDYRWAKLLFGLFIGYIAFRTLLWFTLPAVMPPDVETVNAAGVTVYQEAPSAAFVEWTTGFINFIITVGGVGWYFVSYVFNWGREQFDNFTQQDPIDTVTPSGGNFADPTARDILEQVTKPQPRLTAEQQQLLEIALIKASHEKDSATLAEVYGALTGQQLTCEEE